MMMINPVNLWNFHKAQALNLTNLIELLHKYQIKILQREEI